MRRTMLSDLEIDEVSTVDRPANQHGLITFSKHDADANHNEETLMSQGTAEIEVFDSEGAPVDLETLEHGALVYDNEGNEYAFVEDEEDDEVGKADFGGLAGKARAAGTKVADWAAPRTGAATRESGSWPGKYGPKGRQLNNRGKLALAGAGGAAAAGAGYEATKKSLGDSVLEQLSKAVTENDQRQIIAKALDQVEIAKAEAAEAMHALDEERDLRLEREFIAKADDYNLPVEPEAFGPVLKRLVERMDEDDLEILDAVFKSAGDLLFKEFGHVGGGSNSSIIDSVDALAGEMVAKAGGDFSTAEAQVALFEANPEAYDAYIQEGGR